MFYGGHEALNKSGEVSLRRSQAVDLCCLGGLQHLVAPPSIILPGLRAVAAQRVKAEASESDRRETGGAQISVVVAKIPSL